VRVPTADDFGDDGMQEDVESSDCAHVAGVDECAVIECLGEGDEGLQLNVRVRAFVTAYQQG
jgi:hypothetical protein